MTKYLHKDNHDLPFVDWRKPEHRMEGFLRWLKWRMDWCDLDHYLCNNTYRDTKLSVTKKPMTEEQRFWYSLIFGMTYQSEMSWVIYNEFPDFGEIDLEKMQEWNVKNLPRQRYARDCKYNKGRITDQVASIKENIGPKSTLKDYFYSLTQDSKEGTFDRVYSEVNDKFYKFGRMTTWLLCQTLYETADFPVAPRTMLASDPSSWSVRSGLMYAYGRDELIEAKNKKLRLTKEDIAWVEFKEQEIFETAKNYLGNKYEKIFTPYLLESHLCQYKKLMLGGDYSGHSSGDHVTRANWLAGNWPEVNFEAFYTEAIKSHHELIRGKPECKALRNLCSETGQIINMHLDFPDMPDIYKELELDTAWFDGGTTGEKKVLKQISTYAEKQGLLST